MLNRWMKNFLNGNYQMLRHKFAPDPRLYEYERVVVVGLDSASNRVFTACLEHDLYPSGYCNALGAAFPYWAETFDFMRPVSVGDCNADPGCALVMSEFAYKRIGGLFRGDVYVVTTALDSPMFHDSARCFYTLRDPEGFDSARENDLANYVSLTSTGELKTLSLEAIAFRYAYGKRMFAALNARADTRFVFLVSGSVGDNTAVCCMMEEYKRRFGYRRVAVLVQDDRAEIPAMFPGIDEIVPCQRLDFICLANYFILNYAYGRRDFGNVVFAYFMLTSLRWTGYVHSERDYTLPLFVKFREFLGLPLDAKPARAQVPPGASGGRYAGAVLLIPDGNAVFRELTITREEMFSFFSRLAEALLAKGVRVYVNRPGAGGAAIPGEPFELGLTELMAAAASFRAIVTIPSGIGELLNLTDCRLVHVWPAEEEYNMQCFGSYGGCADASHYLFPGGDGAVLAETIAEDITGEWSR